MLWPLLRKIEVCVGFSLLFLPMTTMVCVKRQDKGLACLRRPVILTYDYYGLCKKTGQGLSLPKRTS